MPPFDSHFWMLLTLCFVPLAVQFIKRPSFFNSSVVNGILLAVIISFLKFSKADQSGTYSTVLFVIFFILPLYAQKKICEKILYEKYLSAQKWLFIIKMICPAFPVKECREALINLQEGHESVSSVALRERMPKSIPCLIANTQLHLMKTDWTSSLKWIEKFKTRDVDKVPWLTLLKLRVLCETNKLEEAIDYTKKIHHNQHQYLFYIIHLIYLASFSGNRKLLEQIFKLPIKDLKEENRQFWVALSLFKNHNYHEEGRELLEQLCQSESKRIASSSKAILRNTDIPEENAYKTSMDNMAAHAFENPDDYLGPKSKSHICTHFFIIINVALYMLSRPDLNSTFPYNNLSEHLVLFLPESAETNQWWRLLTTTFLHGSFLHLISNMFMLLIFGYMIEPYFKTVKMAVIYLGAGLTGMVIVTLNHSPGFPTVTLGASGSTMALMGAYIAILLKQNKRSSVKLRKQQLIFLFVLILIQSRLDIISPQISFTAHISGLVFGLISAYVLYRPIYADLENQIESTSK